MALFARYLLEALPALMMELGFIPWWILVHLGIKNTPVPVVALGDFLRNTEPSGEMCMGPQFVSKFQSPKFRFHEVNGVMGTFGS